MPDEKPVGRAPVWKPPRGRASVGRAVGKAVTPDRELTSVIRHGTPEPPPVFVDPSGGRRKRWRITAYLLGVLLVLTVVAIWVSQLSGPAHPPARTPVTCVSGVCGQ